MLVAWLVGAGLLFLAALRDRLGLWRLLRDAEEPGDDLVRLYRAIAADLRLSRLPRLAVTRALDSPAIAGVFRPAILVPAWMTEQREPGRLTWAVRHELMHAKMFDPFVNALSQFVRILFFFHPVAWWAARRWKGAMELACDHALLGSEKDVREYIDTLHAMLTRMHLRRRPSLSCGLFAARSQLSRRVAALVCHPLRPSKVSPAGIGAVALFAGAALLVGAHIAPTVQAGSGTPWPPGRVLRFSEGPSMGYVYIQPFGPVDDAAWEPVQEAVGDVYVPEGHLARLELANEALADLSPLASVAAGAVQLVTLEDSPSDWEQFRHIGRLKPWRVVLKDQPALGYGGGASGPPPPPNPILAFPEERSMGTLLVQPFGFIDPDAWEPLAEARGDVLLPEDRCLVRLELAPEAMDDLSPLTWLGAKDLHSIAFRRRPARWEDLAHLQGMRIWELEYRAVLGYGSGGSKRGYGANADEARVSHE